MAGMSHAGGRVVGCDSTVALAARSASTSRILAGRSRVATRHNDGRRVAVGARAVARTACPAVRRLGDCRGLCSVAVHFLKRIRF